MSTLPDRRRAALYLRSATEEQSSRDTLERQRLIVEQYCQDHALDVVAHYVDVSAATVPIGERRAGGEMLRDAALGRFDVVLSANTTRIARDFAAIYEYISELRSQPHPVRFFGVLDLVDSEEPAHLARLRLLAGVVR